MDERKHEYTDPWDDGIFGTGRTQPPKNHGGLITLLLILVIFLSGIVCALGILNIRLSRQLEAGREEDYLSISFSDTNAVPNVMPTDPVSPGKSQLNLELEPLPEEIPEKSAGTAVNWAQVYEKNLPSVVSISCTGGENRCGTGVILSADGYIVTNAHVVEGAEEIVVLLSDDRMFYAQLVGSDCVSDLAVLYIDAEDLTPAEFGDSSLVQVGDSVVAIGDPLGVELRGTMTDGIISAINRNVTIEGREMTLLQTNAALNSGNSGGPLINQYGQVIGINTVKIGTLSDGVVLEGLGFAIPSAIVKEIVVQLVNDGYVAGRPILGIQGEALSEVYRNYYDLPEGLCVTFVMDGSPADLLGIGLGDIIISIDGNQILTPEDLNHALYNHQPGDRVEIVIYRSGKQVTGYAVLASEQCQ